MQLNKYFQSTLGSGGAGSETLIKMEMTFNYSDIFTKISNIHGNDFLVIFIFF